jgi:hypothetical protein
MLAHCGSNVQAVLLLPDSAWQGMDDMPGSGLLRQFPIQIVAPDQREA